MIRNEHTHNWKTTTDISWSDYCAEHDVPTDHSEPPLLAARTYDRPLSQWSTKYEARKARAEAEPVKEAEPRQAITLALAQFIDRCSEPYSRHSGPGVGVTRLAPVKKPEPDWQAKANETGETVFLCPRCSPKHRVPMAWRMIWQKNLTTGEVSEGHEAWHCSRSCGFYYQTLRKGQAPVSLKRWLRESNCVLEPQATKQAAPVAPAPKRRRRRSHSCATEGCENRAFGRKKYCVTHAKLNRQDIWKRSKAKYRGSVEANHLKCPPVTPKQLEAKIAPNR